MPGDCYPCKHGIDNLANNHGTFQQLQILALIALIQLNYSYIDFFWVERSPCIGYNKEFVHGIHNLANDHGTFQQLQILALIALIQLNYSYIDFFLSGEISLHRL